MDRIRLSELLKDNGDLKDDKLTDQFIRILVDPNYPDCNIEQWLDIKADYKSKLRQLKLI